MAFAGLEREDPTSYEGISTMNWMRSSIALAITGDKENHSKFCRIMFEQFKEPSSMVAERVAKAALMLPSDSEITQKALFYVSHLQFDDSVEKALIPWNLFTSALASYRNNEFAKARALSEKSLEESVNQTGGVILLGLNHALCANLDILLGNKGHAQQNLQSAETELQESLNYGMQWHDNYLIELLIEEAKARQP